jgi:hypothetical protein
MPEQVQAQKDLPSGWTIDRIKSHIDAAIGIASSCIKLATFSGGILLIIYAIKERFFYDVSSLAAIGVLLVVTLSFAFVLAYGVALCFFCSLSLIWLGILVLRMFGWSSERIVQPLNNWIVLTASVVTLAFVTCFTIQQVNFGKWLFLTEVTYFSIAGFLLALFFAIEPVTPVNSSQRLSQNALIGLILIMSPMMLVPRGTGLILNQVMDLLSLRSLPNAPITITDALHDKIAAIASAEAFTFKPCHLQKNLWITRELTLIWHGPGSTSFAALGEGTNRSMIIPVPSADVDALAGDIPERENCPAHGDNRSEQ